MASTLGQRIRDVRKARGKTQQEAADYVGIARPSLVGWEKDTTKPTLENLTKLCKFLNVDAAALLDGTVLNSATQADTGPVAVRDILGLVRIVAARDIGFEPTPEQALRWLVKKAGIGDAILALESGPSQTDEATIVQATG
jgi:transcriptional regulator with XRE-family HTH domain